MYKPTFKERLEFWLHITGGPILVVVIVMGIHSCSPTVRAEYGEPYYATENITMTNLGQGVSHIETIWARCISRNGRAIHCDWKEPGKLERE